MRRVLWQTLGGTALIVGVLAAIVVFLNLRGEDPIRPNEAASPSAEQVRRGAYLALAGNCAGCHTARGGAAFAGGSGVVTPFGTVFSSNLTPDRATGLGAWNADEFWRALHHGRSREGRLLYPAFPYPNYTHVSRADADALFAYLQSLAPVAQAATPSTLRFPYRLQASLAVWRALYFRAADPAADADPGRTAEWNRGRELVRGLAHCGACHASRGRWGATIDEDVLGGGLIPVQHWYAPALNRADEAGVAGWPLADVVELLKTGRAAHGSVAGPMADIVFRSTQYLSDADLAAMAVYLRALPPAASAAAPTAAGVEDPNAMRLGATLYHRHCAACHGEAGQGATRAYPALAGNRAVLLGSPANLVKLVVGGGYLPATGGNPRPYGMPPFGSVLDDSEVAAVLTYIRRSWGNQAMPVATLDVLHLR